MIKPLYALGSITTEATVKIGNLSSPASGVASSLFSNMWSHQSRNYNQYVSKCLLLIDLRTKKFHSPEEDIAIAPQQWRQDVITQ